MGHIVLSLVGLGQVRDIIIILSLVGLGKYGTY
jgi:hypothetical protein